MAYEWLNEASENIIVNEAVEWLDVLYEWGDIDEYDYEEILETASLEELAEMVDYLYEKVQWKQRKDGSWYEYDEDPAAYDWAGEIEAHGSREGQREENRKQVSQDTRVNKKTGRTERRKPNVIQRSRAVLNRKSKPLRGWVKDHPKAIKRTGIGAGIAAGTAGLAYGGKKLMNYKKRREACLVKGYAPGTPQYKQCMQSQR